VSGVTLSIVAENVQISWTASDTTDVTQWKVCWDDAEFDATAVALEQVSCEMTTNSVTSYSIPVMNACCTHAIYVSVGGVDSFGNSENNGEMANITYYGDVDFDGYNDDVDVFPNNPNEWQDTDGDGVGDNSDAFPNDPDEWLDTDGDGVGDNADAFPNDPDEWLDSDGDGVGDNSDAFPNDPDEWLDTDGDKVGDNADVFPENKDEWLDTDGDKVGDNADVFPNDSTEWSDEDGDGVGDRTDPFPNTGMLSSWTPVAVAITVVIIAVLAIMFTVRSRKSDGDWKRGIDYKNEVINSMDFDTLPSSISPPSSPNSSISANNGVDQGYEWLSYQDTNYYRIQGSMGEWQQYQN